jgi:glycosyltransferase involved in cell wall biosynthesis
MATRHPNILFFRYDKYGFIDHFLKENKDKLYCNINIINNCQELNKLFDPNYHLLVTFGDKENQYYSDVNSIIVSRMRKRWLHYSAIENIDLFNYNVNYCYINNVTQKHSYTRTIFSIFTTCYKTFEKIHRVYNSVKQQTFKDWEWVIIDDSPEDDNFEFLRILFKDDKRIRLYRRSENSGSIGNVKNEAVSLCRGKYVLELDHDDEILPSCLQDAVDVFEKHEDVGFVFNNYSNVYENGNNFSYGDLFALGYAGYYMQKHNNKWINVATNPNINNITLSHIVSVPNHSRIWRKDTLLQIGNYSEFLPICDDYELLIRTAIHTKMAKINKLGYIQYMNDGGNNFSYIRNAEINRLVPRVIRPQSYNDYKVHDEMKEKNAYEDEKYIYNYSQIWKRENDYEHKYCNLFIIPGYDKIYCIIGIDVLNQNIEKIRELYKNDKNDFIILDNKIEKHELTNHLDYNHFDKMKCYVLKDHTDSELIKYFRLIYSGPLNNYEILTSNPDLNYSCSDESAFF